MRNQDKRYSVRQTVTGKLKVMVSHRICDDSPGMFRWSKYVPAGQEELNEVLELLMASENK